MDTSKNQNDIERMSETTSSVDYEWNEEFESEHISEHLEDEIDEADKDTESESSDDVMADFFMDLDDQDTAAARAARKKKRLQELFGVAEKKKAVGSEETIITEESEKSSTVTTRTDSSIHPCLKDIDISDSAMKLTNLYTIYPIPEDPGIGPAFSILTPQISYLEGGIFKFIERAMSKNLRPIKSIVNMLMATKINLRFYGIDPRIICVIYEALQKNDSVQIIDLTDNWLTKEACYQLGELIRSNVTLTHLILSRCRIGPKGAAGLQDGIKLAQALVVLDVSSCKLGEEGLSYIVLGMRDNQSIEELNLSNNGLDNSCAQHLEVLLTDSKSLTRLNLSWNSLYTPAVWRAIGRGFRKNYSLAELNVSWNSLNSECISHFNAIFRSFLQVLNISGNQFTSVEAAVIAKLLTKNTTLFELYLGSNPIKPDGVFELISSLVPTKAVESNLHLLDLENIWADKTILPDLQIIENEKPWLQIKLGGIYSNYEVKGPDVMRLVLRRAQYEAMAPKKKRLRKNFGHFVLSLTDKPIPRDKKIKSATALPFYTAQFRKLVARFKLKLSANLINYMIEAFAAPKRTVDQGLLKAVYLSEYPDTQPPKEKKKKAKKTLKDIEAEEPMQQKKHKEKKEREEFMDDGEQYFTYHYDWYESV